MTKQKKNIGFKFDNSYTSLSEELFTYMDPVPVKKPELVIFNDKLSSELGLCTKKISEEELAEIFSGNILLEGSKPIAQAYAGHQFGGFTILGDGRAHLLGEHINSEGERVDIQLKGSGKTIYGRRGDGRAALGPMLREYIISEAMYGMGIPTTRSLAVVTTGEKVLRESKLTGAILTRLASSHIRVGTFEYAARNGKEAVKQLADYTIERHYPELKESDQRYLDLIKKVMGRQVALIIDWLRVGFIHGVMNTDNMAISGETIDYGPCAFMDIYDPQTVFSSIDRNGRYSYANQPHIVNWNLARFSETLLPLLHEDIKRSVKLVERILESYGGIFQKAWLQMMRSKLGLFGKEKEDEKIISDLLQWMQKNSADYTNTFYSLICEKMPEGKNFEEDEFKNWWKSWQDRLRKNKKPTESSLSLMRSNNPFVIPRNHMVEDALNAAEEKKDFSKFEEILKAVSSPYEANSKFDKFRKLPKPEERIYQTFCGT